MTKRTIVVGGGVIGLCTAYYLARGGGEVLLLERDRIGAGASSGNAGAVAPGHGPMAKPGRILQALRWMGDPTSPLYMPPRLNPNLFRWLWKFRRPEIDTILCHRRLRDHSAHGFVQSSGTQITSRSPWNRPSVLYP